MSMNSPTSSPEDSPMSSYEDSPMSSPENSTMSSPDDSEVICSCGLPAKLIISMNRNPYRLFYNCPRGQNNQCGFRQRFDETIPIDNQHVDQINLISTECIQLQERIVEIKKERGQEWSLWFKERAELNSQLSAVKDELNKIKSEIKPANKSNPISAGVTFHTMSTSSPEDSPVSSPEDSPMSSPESSPENSEVQCFCGRLAKLRLSMTAKNPDRLFYHCPKRQNKQCGFFQWIDEPIPTGNRRVDEMKLISSELNRLQERINKIKQERDHERSHWNREKMELQSQLSAVKDELDKIKGKIKLENDELNKIKSKTKLETDGLDKIKSEIKLEDDSGSMPPLKLDKIKSEVKLEDESGSMPTSSAEDSPMSSYEDSPMSSPANSPMSSPDDSEVICSCGLPAKLIISMNRNPYRLFYNCPRGQNNQCGFRQRFDETIPTDKQHVDQINLISTECIQLQERIVEIEKERGQEWSLWFKERAELNAQLSAVKDELNKMKSEIKPVNKSNPISAGVTFHTMSMSSPEDSPVSSPEDSPVYSPEDSPMSSPENSEVLCFCGRVAKQRLSMTAKNPDRLFYHCPKRRNKQCGFFQWIDEPIPTGNRRVDEMNLISSELNRLQKRIAKIKQGQDHERSQWNREKMELHSQLSAVKDELNKIKGKIKLENDELDKIRSKIKLENDGLDKIKSEIKLEDDSGSMPPPKLDKIKSEIKLENDELDKIKSEVKLEDESVSMPPLKKIKSEIRQEHESGSNPPLH